MSTENTGTDNTETRPPEDETPNTENVEAESPNTENTKSENNHDDISKTSERIIKQHVAWAVGAGLVPFPLLDVLAVSGIQLDMLKQLCRVHEISYTETSGKAMLSAVTGSTLARMGASMVKAIPGIGTLAGMASMPILSGASTYAIGHAAIWHFENGGDLFDIDFDTIKNIYKELFRAGKEMAQDISRQFKSKQSASASSSRDEILHALEELVKKKEEGQISEEEFETKKQDLLNQL